MKKLNPNQIEENEPTPRVERFTKKSNRNPKKDEKRRKRSKRVNSDRYMY